MAGGYHPLQTAKIPPVPESPGWSDMPKVTLTPCKSTNPPELKSARCAQSTPNLDVRLTRTQSGNILDIDFEFGAHGAGAACGCLCVVLP